MEEITKIFRRVLALVEIFIWHGRVIAVINHHAQLILDTEIIFIISGIVVQQYEKVLVYNHSRMILFFTEIKRSKIVKLEMPFLF